MVRGGDGRQVFDWVLDRNARRASGLALVMVVALLGSWLAVEAVVRWRESERSVERARLLDQTAQALMAQVQGGGLLGVVSLLGLSEPLRVCGSLKNVAVTRSLSVICHVNFPNASLLSFLTVRM